MMKPISYVDALNNHYGSMGFPPYQWTINDTAPLHRVSKPLAECRISMLTSGGVSHCTLPGFDPDARNDHRLDTVPGEVSTVDFNINDSYYNHDDADSDLNCIFPIDRLRELAASGEIGSTAPRFWSGFMGRIYNRTKVIEESAPAFVEKLREDAVDILVAAPA
ncbi:glycine/sarcosine/betaine reductase selenoprotein B family protein [Pseudomonadales bacterium]|nr:glycine/sarcosine/betaine reductase selenoprotein B family protein [Pseudomonadales bacterium]